VAKKVRGKHHSKNLTNKPGFKGKSEEKEGSTSIKSPSWQRTRRRRFNFITQSERWLFFGDTEKKKSGRAAIFADRQKKQK